MVSVEARELDYVDLKTVVSGDLTLFAAGTVDHRRLRADAAISLQACAQGPCDVRPFGCQLQRAAVEAGDRNADVTVGARLIEEAPQLFQLQAGSRLIIMGVPGMKDDRRIIRWLGDLEPVARFTIWYRSS